MKFLAIIVALVLAACSPKAKPSTDAGPEPTIGTSITLSGLDVCFSPAGGCEAKIVNFIMAEDKEILVQAYSFTDVNIENALIAKKNIVHILLDRTDLGTTILQDFLNNGMDVLIDKKHPIAHNKLIITPGAVETGSFNYTNQAEKYNAENALFIKYKPLAQKYRDNWMAHKAHSVTPGSLGDAGVKSGHVLPEEKEELDDEIDEVEVSARQGPNKLRRRGH
jgi:phosphatidylserine/phosphatidylglycerophosphate/cardiolipin synthase-like enzyme